MGSTAQIELIKLLANRRVKKPTKYGNVKVTVDGHVFDSKKEATQYGILNMRKRAGEIFGFTMQVKYDFVVNGVKICSYIADFVTEGKNGREVIDVKSDVTRKNRLYRVKCKLMKAIYNIDIKEV